MMKPMNMMVDYCFIVTIRTCNDLQSENTWKQNMPIRWTSNELSVHTEQGNKGNTIYLSILGIVLSMGNTHFGLSMDYQSS